MIQNIHFGKRYKFEAEGDKYKYDVPFEVPRHSSPLGTLVPNDDSPLSRQYFPPLDKNLASREKAINKANFKAKSDTIEWAIADFVSEKKNQEVRTKRVMSLDVLGTKKSA